MADARIPSLLQDLGKPTRRGIRKCHKCGTLTGTRGKSCKNPSCDVLFRENTCNRKVTSTSVEVSRRVALQSQNYRVYSVRTYHRGPDYRTFVQLPMPQTNFSVSNSTSTAKSVSFGTRCYSDACSGVKAFSCSHIKAAEECSKDSKRICIKESVLSTIGIPTEAKEVLSGIVCQTPDLIVQRCSTQAFVVNCGTVSIQPFGLCHMLFFKLCKEDDKNTEQRFLCSCHSVKLIRRDQDDSSYDSSSSKYCLHYYACVYAFASNDELATEFESFLLRAFEVYPESIQSLDYFKSKVMFRLNALRHVANCLVHFGDGTTILSELHVTLSRTQAHNEEIEALERPHPISVKIMRENLCLLESIAAVPSAQCSLSDHTAINTTDDALSFGESSTLDSLDENDPNCTTHLTHISEILTPSTQNPHHDEVLDSSSAQVEEKVLETQGSEFHHSGSSSDSQQNTSPSNRRKRLKMNITENPNRPSTTLEEPNTQALPLLSTKDKSESPDYVLERKLILSNFGRWLGSLNERMNAAMNYQLSKTCFVVDYVAHEIFESLNVRLDNECKRKSEIVLTTRRDRPPLGTFRKHVWTIFSIKKLLNIFQSTQVPLKLSQCFVQTSNGLYVEWIQCQGQEKRHKQQILPVLHCSKLKVGKLGSTDKELTPFVIEWIPEILRSNIGELSITFQVTHIGPIQTEEERKAVHAPIQRLIQQSKSFSIIRKE